MAEGTDSTGALPGDPGPRAAGVADAGGAPAAAAAADAGAAPTGGRHGEGADAPDPVLLRLDELTRAIEEGNRISQDRERVVDRLHEENQRLRAGELAQMLAPIFRDLVRLYDDLERTARAYEARGDAVTTDAARDVASYRDAVLDLLYRHGVEPYDAPEGTPFAASEHRALKPIPTSDPAKDRTIARVIRRGFRTDARIVRALEAEVYRLQKDPGAPPGAPADNANPRGS